LIQLGIVPNPVNDQTPIDFYIRVSGYHGVPTGQVALLLNGAAWSPATGLDSHGEAHYHIAGYGVGEYEISVAYSGDSTYGDAISDSVHLSVIPGVETLTLIASLAYPSYPLPQVIITNWAVAPNNWGFNFFNVYRVEVSGNYTGLVTFVVPNNPYALLLYPDNTVLYNGPMGIHLDDRYAVGNPPQFSGPVGDIGVTNGVGTLIVGLHCYGLYPPIGGRAFANIWLNAYAGGRQLVVNGGTTFVLQLVAE
jgi:hypothetical protein